MSYICQGSEITDRRSVAVFMIMIDYIDRSSHVLLHCAVCFLYVCMYVCTIQCSRIEVESERPFSSSGHVPEETPFVERLNALKQLVVHHCHYHSFKPFIDVEI